MSNTRTGSSGPDYSFIEGDYNKNRLDYIKTSFENLGVDLKIIIEDIVEDMHQIGKQIVNLQTNKIQNTPEIETVIWDHVKEAVDQCIINELKTFKEDVHNTLSQIEGLFQKEIVLLSANHSNLTLENTQLRKLIFFQSLPNRICKDNSIKFETPKIFYYYELKWVEFSSEKWEKVRELYISEEEKDNVTFFKKIYPPEFKNALFFSFI